MQRIEREHPGGAAVIEVGDEVPQAQVRVGEDEQLFNAAMAPARGQRCGQLMALFLEAVVRKRLRMHFEDVAAHNAPVPQVPVVRRVRAPAALPQPPQPMPYRRPPPRVRLPPPPRLRRQRAPGGGHANPQ